jgi:scrB_fam: sucrose-6-phosphate hydrolase
MKNRKQAYHIETEKGLINDPNGLSYFKGKYYVFFQWNPNATDHSYKVWGKTTSQDLIHWSEPVIALQASEAYDKDGTYSGSAVSDGETLSLYYTGNVKVNGVRYPEQCLAQSEDGIHFKKYGSVLSLPDDYTGHFRDPKVTKEDVWKMIIGGQNKKTGKGDIIQYTSIDGTSFKFNKIIGISKQYEMIECPDLFTLDAHEVLIYGLQSRNNDTDECLDAHAVYLIDTVSDLDKGLHMDEGYDFYAPQTFVDNQGRRIMLAWMSRFSDAQEVEFAKDGHIHCLTMPRELFVKKEN